MRIKFFLTAILDPCKIHQKGRAVNRTSKGDTNNNEQA